MHSPCDVVAYIVSIAIRGTDGQPSERPALEVSDQFDLSDALVVTKLGRFQAFPAERDDQRLFDPRCRIGIGGAPERKGGGRASCPGVERTSAVSMTGRLSSPRQPRGRIRIGCGIRSPGVSEAGWRAPTFPGCGHSRVSNIDALGISLLAKVASGIFELAEAFRSIRFLKTSQISLATVHLAL